MGKDEEIIVDFNSKENDSARNLSDAEKQKVENIKEKLKAELGLEILKELERQGLKPEEETQPKTQAEQIEEKPKEDPVKKAQERYAKFMQQYSNSDEVVDVSSAGKYDSDLDFQLNQKIKKVRFPMPKPLKILVCCLALILVAGLSIGLLLYFKEDAPQILLTNVTLSQPKNGSYYLVNNVYVGDTLNCDSIYLNCEYSDGSYKEVELNRDMINVATTKINSSDVFIESGEALVHIKYQGKTLNLKYIVQEKILQSISLFTPSATSTYNIVATSATLDITNSVIVNGQYNNGVTQKIDLTKCSYKLAGMQSFSSLRNGKINLSGLNNNQIYEVLISYGEHTASIKVYTNFN